MSEAIKCKNRIMQYLNGNVLDIGVDDNKLVPWAVGIDLCRVTPQVNLIGDAKNLYWFKDCVFDTVFSSHCLEDLKDTKSILKEWLRVVKHGGHLILYLPHKNFYPNIGQPFANAGHQHDFLPEDIVKIMNEIGGTKLISNNTYGEKFIQEIHHKQEYSFEQVYQKL
jgi:ubiquinone/menaquinone biosynthesis C-methylase UbiE